MTTIFCFIAAVIGGLLAGPVVFGIQDLQARRRVARIEKESIQRMALRAQGRV